MNFNRKHGIDIMFITGDRCHHCRKPIVDQPGIYAFLWRGTMAHASAYYHVSCAKKIKPIKAKRSGITCRVSKKEILKDELYYRLGTNTRGTSLRVKVGSFKKIMKATKSQTSLYKECLKSRNTASVNKAIENMPPKLIKALKLTEYNEKLLLKRDKLRAAAKRKQELKKVPIPSMVRIKKALKSVKPRVHKAGKVDLFWMSLILQRPCFINGKKKKKKKLKPVLNVGGLKLSYSLSRKDIGHSIRVIAQPDVRIAFSSSWYNKFAYKAMEKIRDPIAKFINEKEEVKRLALLNEFSISTENLTLKELCSEKFGEDLVGIIAKKMKLTKSKKDIPIGVVTLMLLDKSALVRELAEKELKRRGI